VHIKDEPYLLVSAVAVPAIKFDPDLLLTSSVDVPLNLDQNLHFTPTISVQSVFPEANSSEKREEAELSNIETKSSRDSQASHTGSPSKRKRKCPQKVWQFQSQGSDTGTKVIEELGPKRGRSTKAKVEKVPKEALSNTGRVRRKSDPKKRDAGIAGTGKSGSPRTGSRTRGKRKVVKDLDPEGDVGIAEASTSCKTKTVSGRKRKQIKDEEPEGDAGTGMLSSAKPRTVWSRKKAKAVKDIELAEDGAASPSDKPKKVSRKRKKANVVEDPELEGDEASSDVPKKVGRKRKKTEVVEDPDQTEQEEDDFPAKKSKLTMACMMKARVRLFKISVSDCLTMAYVKGTRP